MKRRKFIVAALGAPVVAAHNAQASGVAPSDFFVVKAGEARFGVHTPFKSVNDNDVKISGKDTGGQLAVFEYLGREKVGPSLHVHHHQDEIFSIIEGEYLFQVGEEQFNVKAGDTVFAPRGVPHTWIQLSDQGKQVYAVQPAGKLEEMFTRLSKFQGPPTEQEVQQIHKECGLEVLGPPLKLK